MSTHLHTSILMLVCNRRYAIGDTDACVSGQLDFLPIPLGRPACQVVLFVSAIWLLALTKLQQIVAILL